MPDGSPLWLRQPDASAFIASGEKLNPRFDEAVLNCRDGTQPGINLVPLQASEGTKRDYGGTPRFPLVAKYQSMLGSGGCNAIAT
jgi:hypothetical protein